MQRQLVQLDAKYNQFYLVDEGSDPWPPWIGPRKMSKGI